VARRGRRLLVRGLIASVNFYSRGSAVGLDGRAAAAPDPSVQPEGAGSSAAGLAVTSSEGARSSLSFIAHLRLIRGAAVAGSRLLAAVAGSRLLAAVAGSRLFELILTCAGSLASG
jgi:hypothetical protein